MARLAARLASGVLAPQGFGFALETITGGRLAAVGTVHVEALFEFLDAGLELGEKFTNGVQPTRLKGGMDYRTQGFGSVAQHSAVINTREIT